LGHNCERLLGRQGEIPIRRHCQTAKHPVSTSNRPPSTCLTSYPGCHEPSRALGRHAARPSRVEPSLILIPSSSGALLLGKVRERNRDASEGRSNVNNKQLGLSLVGHTLPEPKVKKNSNQRRERETIIRKNTFGTQARPFNITSHRTPLLVLSGQSHPATHSTMWPTLRPELHRLALNASLLSLTSLALIVYAYAFFAHIARGLRPTLLDELSEFTIQKPRTTSLRAFSRTG
jgi:hypothetical protein